MKLQARILFLLFLQISQIFGNNLSGWEFLRKNSILKPLTGISSQCLNETETWLKSLELFSTISAECFKTKNCTSEEKKIMEENVYAVEQLDAFGKIPLTGLFNIPLLWEGSYQECQRISGIKYQTNYCYLSVLPGENKTCSASTLISVRSAVCLPKSCSQTDMTNIFNQLTPIPLTACATFCSDVEVEKDSAFWGYTIFLIIIVAIAIVSTVIDFLLEESKYSKLREKNIGLKLLLTFSFWTNAEILLSVKDHKPGFIKCLDCIRTLSMMWVVTGHSYIYLIPPDEVAIITPFFGKFWNHFLLNAFVSVDSFFTLSGVVVGYLFFKTKPKKSIIMSPITWILFYVHRYLRLTPPIMLFIGFFTVYAPYIQGPFSAALMNQFITQSDNCKNSWWKNLLYINNFGDANMECYAITWYLAVDTQIYLVMPILLVAFYFSFAAGTFLTLAGIVGSVITTYIIYSEYDLAADFFGNGNNLDIFQYAYTKPWIRCTPYLVGILTGYILATYGKRKIRLNWTLSIIGWICAFGIGAASLFSTYDYDKGSEWSVFTRATFYNFSRLGWSIGLCWIIIANHMGWGGPINYFMSHPIWQPFGRLSYCSYIVHWMVLYYFYNIGDKEPHYYSTWQFFVYYAIPATFMSFFFAFFWSCLFELPTLKLEKMLIETFIGKRGPVSNKVQENGNSYKTESIEDKSIKEKEKRSWS